MANRQNPFTYNNTANTVSSVASVPSQSGMKKLNHVDADEFNSKLYQWETEYEQSVEKMQRDYDLQMQKIYASAAQAMIKNGINLTGEQLESIGWTEPQYMAYRYYNG